MRAIGAVLLFVALLVAAYALFALGWDGGTSRVWGDYALLAAAAGVALGGAGMLARRGWGAWLGFVLGALLALATVAPLLS